MHRYSKARTMAVALAAGLLSAVLIPLGATAAAASSSSIVFSGAPGTSAPPSTLGSYSMTPFSADSQAVGQDVSGVKGPNGSVGFSPSLEHDQVGNGWATWSNGYTGDVYSTESDTVALTLPAGTKAFYFYAEPDQFMTFSMTATSTDGTSSGPIQVAGQAGAQYFGFYSADASSLKTITVTSGDPDGFAVGEFGVSACAYNTPTSWNTAQVAGYTPGVEPLNVIISGCSNVSLGEVLKEMGDWDTVPGTCLSTEQANVTGTFVGQQQSWRLEGCYDGNKLSLSGQENHARIWNQPVAGSEFGAWFIAASYETACAFDPATNTMTQVKTLTEFTEDKLLGLAWHCIDGGQGSLSSDGYDDGALGFVATIQNNAAASGWNVSVQTVSRPAGIGEGHGTGVPFSGTAYVVTIDRTAAK
jgi:hypothetical protein